MRPSARALHSSGSKGSSAPGRYINGCSCLAGRLTYGPLSESTARLLLRALALLSSPAVCHVRKSWADIFVSHAAGFAADTRRQAVSQ